jgi:hypothetical protein
MLARFLQALAKLFNPRPKTILQLPVFYTVIVGPGSYNIAQETTRSIHRARGVCRQLRAQGMHVAIATYTAESITEEF